MILKKGKAVRAKRTLLIAAVILIVASAAATGHSADLAGEVAPDFTLKSIRGSDVALSSYKGKVVLLNFWSVWCMPCREELPSMNKLYLKYKDNGLVVLAVSTDDDTESVDKLLIKNPVDFPVLMDAGMKVSKRKYHVNAEPTTFLIGKDGKIIRKYFGSVDWMDDAVQKEITAHF
ncbi:MAG: TlpA family protein disulfide reductase [Nitrospirae bacterium]|nr:TlpA family protein disulfide reductase [Nitrospirota bacterium]